MYLTGSDLLLFYSLVSPLWGQMICRTRYLGRVITAGLAFSLSSCIGISGESQTPGRTVCLEPKLTVSSYRWPQFEGWDPDGWRYLQRGALLTCLELSVCLTVVSLPLVVIMCICSNLTEFLQFLFSFFSLQFLKFSSLENLIFQDERWKVKGEDERPSEAVYVPWCVVAEC